MLTRVRTRSSCAHHSAQNALLLVNEEGESFVLLSSLAKPCRVSDPANPLGSQARSPSRSRASHFAENCPIIAPHGLAVDHLALVSLVGRLARLRAPLPLRSPPLAIVPAPAEPR